MFQHVRRHAVSVEAWLVGEKWLEVSPLELLAESSFLKRRLDKGVHLFFSYVFPAESRWLPPRVRVFSFEARGTPLNMRSCYTAEDLIHDAGPRHSVTRHRLPYCDKR